MDDIGNDSCKSVKSEKIISSLRNEIESEVNSDSYSEADELDDESVTSEDTSKQVEHVSTEVKVRTDSISLEDLEEIINESSTSDSEIKFSDAEEISFNGPLSKEHRSDSISTLNETLTTTVRLSRKPQRIENQMIGNICTMMIQVLRLMMTFIV